MEYLPLWAVAFALSFAVCGLMVFAGPRDAPDGDRKDQPRPVPSAGGIGIAAGYVGAAVLGLALSPVGPLTNTIVLMSLALGFLTVGFLDDWLDMPASRKLRLLLGLSILTCAIGWNLLGFGYGGPVNAWMMAGLIAGGSLWIFVVSNAANFMDGSNGLSLGSLAIMLTALGQILWMNDILIAAIAAFLIWNMAGRLYAGDSGAFFVGFLFAAMALHGAFWGEYSIWIPPLIALPFLVDIILTIIWRGVRGGNVMQAHREHAYQLMRRFGWGHWPTALVWWALSAACGAVAVWASDQTHNMQLLAFLGAAVLLTVLWMAQRFALWPKVSSPG